MSDNNYIGNISTIVKFVSMAIAGWALGALAAKGLDLPIDAETLSECIGTIILFILAWIDATYFNSFNIFGNKKSVEMGTVLGYPKEEEVLNDDYISDDSEPSSSEDGV